MKQLLLQLSFVQCRSDDKTAVLLHLLRNVIKPAEQTVIFAATKHHVDFLNMVRFSITNYSVTSHMICFWGG